MCILVDNLPSEYSFYTKEGIDDSYKLSSLVSLVMDRISPAFLNNVSPILLEQLRQIVASNQQQLDNNNSNQVTPQRYQPSQTRPWPKYGQQRSNSVSTIKHTPPPEDTVYYTRVNQVSIKDEIFKQLNQGRHTPQNQFTPHQNRQETPTNMNSLAMMNSKGVK